MAFGCEALTAPCTNLNSSDLVLRKRTSAAMTPSLCSRRVLVALDAMHWLDGVIAQNSGIAEGKDPEEDASGDCVTVIWWT